MTTTSRELRLAHWDGYRRGFARGYWTAVAGIAAYLAGWDMIRKFRRRAR